MSCRLNVGSTPPQSARTRLASPNARRLNSARSAAALSKGPPPIGRSCHFRRDVSSLALTADMCATGAEKKTNFEVIVGRSLPEDRDARYLGLDHGYDNKPKRRLVGMLVSQGFRRTR